MNKHYNTLRYCNGLTYTDLIQEGWIGLLEAANRYDDDKEVKYSTYAYYWVEKYILQSLGGQIKTKQAERQYEQEVFADPVECLAHVGKGMDELSEQEREIISLYADGYSTREIANEMDDDISHMTVARRLNKIGFVTKQG